MKYLKRFNEGIEIPKSEAITVSKLIEELEQLDTEASVYVVSHNTTTGIRDINYEDNNVVISPSDSKEETLTVIELVDKLEKLPNLNSKVSLDVAGQNFDVNKVRYKKNKKVVLLHSYPSEDSHRGNPFFNWGIGRPPWEMNPYGEPEIHGDPGNPYEEFRDPFRPL